MNARTYEVNPFAIDEVRIIPVAAYSSGGGLSDEAKQAILDAFEHVAWIDDQGQTYIDAIRDAFYPPTPATSISLNKSALSFTTIGATQTLVATVMPSDSTDTVTWSSSDTSVVTVNNGVVTTVAYGSATITATAGNVSATCSVVVAQATLTSISAVYTQSGTVYDTDSLDSLKSDLVVTATWSDSSTSTVAANDYTLSGTLTEGTSTITVAYGGKTTTFNVTVTRGIDYTADLLSDVTWNDGYTYNNSGVLTATTGEHCTEKFDAQTCIYDLANADTTNNQYIKLFVWDENDNFLGKTSDNQLGHWMLKEGYKYAVSAYGNSVDKTKLTFAAVDNRSTAVEPFEIVLSDYVSSLANKTSYYEVNLSSVLSSNGLTQSNWNTAINSVNGIQLISKSGSNISVTAPFSIPFRFSFWQAQVLMVAAASVGNNNLSGMQDYITNNDIRIRFNYEE